MLCLSRKEGEWIQVGDARVFVLHASHGRVSIGVEAPRDVKIVRGELLEREKDKEAA